MLPWLIPAAVSLIGGFLSHKGQKNQEQEARANERAAQYQAWLAGRGPFERNAASRAALAQMAQYWIGKKGGPNISPDVLAKLTNPTTYPDFTYVPGAPQSSTVGAIGGALSSIAPFVGLPQSLSHQMQSGGPSPFDLYLAAQAAGKVYQPYPGTYAAQTGGLYGPPPEVPIETLTGGGSDQPQWGY